MKITVKKPNGLQVPRGCSREKEIIVTKPKSLQVKQKWLRASDIVEQYNVGLSTIYFWRAKGVIKIWKKVSERVTVYCSSEIEELFNPTSKVVETSPDIERTETSIKKRVRRKRKPVLNKIIEGVFDSEKATTVKRKARRKKIDINKNRIPDYSGTNNTDSSMIASFMKKKEKSAEAKSHKEFIECSALKKHKQFKTSKQGIMGENVKKGGARS